MITTTDTHDIQATSTHSDKPQAKDNRPAIHFQWQDDNKGAIAGFVSSTLGDISALDDLEKRKELCSEQAKLYIAMIKGLDEGNTVASQPKT